MLTAAVLAGGRSVRMGRDKASLLLDGIPLLKVVADRAASCSDEVLVVGRAGFPGLEGVRFVPDLGDLGGPPSSMRGLHAALAHARGEFVLLLPCDMPFFDVGLVEYMKGLRPGADVVLPCPGGRCEPLCALYRASLAARAGALLEEGVLRLRALLEGPELRVRLVEEGDYPFEEDAFFNINTPEDYRRALGLRRAWNGENGGADMRDLGREDRERNDGRTSVDLETAQALIARDVAPIVGTERVPPAEGLGRVLSEDVRMEGDLPPFDRSPLDGYALRSADTQGAAPDAPVVLSVTDTVHAGRRGSVAVVPGTAVRLMTGAPIPEGADCVVPFERVEEDGESIRLSLPLGRHENYCFRGEDIRKGTTAARAGTRVDSRSIGVLASSGLTLLPVRRHPRIAVFSTGDELVPPGTPLGPGKIHDSNSLVMDFALRELVHGLTPRNLGHMPDDVEHVAELIRGLSDCDLVVTSGGVSTGDKDIFHDVFDRLGARTIFRRVMVKPGTPVMVVRMGQTVLAALSGNPFAMFVDLQLFVRPILAALTGDTGLLLWPEMAEMENDYPRRSSMRRFLRASLQGSRVRAPEPGETSPGMIAKMAGSDVLIDIPAGNGGLRAGDAVRIWRIR